MQMCLNSAMDVHDLYVGDLYVTVVWKIFVWVLNMFQRINFCGLPIPIKIFNSDILVAI